MARSVSDLGADLDPALLSEVAEGTTIEVTRDGTVVALLVPVPAPNGVNVRRATVRGGFSTLARVDVDEPTQAILDDLRSDR